MFSDTHGVRCAVRHYGVSSGTISKWRKRAVKIELHPIPTRSSRPKRHPIQLSTEFVWKIYHTRILNNRCAEVVHQELINDGIIVSLSTVKRVLDRMHLTKKRSPWKLYHPHVDRPYPLKPGDLVQIDTMQSEKACIPLSS